MNTRLIVTISVVLALGISIFLFPFGVTGVIVGAICSSGVIWFVQRNKTLDGNEKKVLIQIFLIGLILRALAAAIIYGSEMEMIVGPDALGYHSQGKETADEWWHRLTQYSASTDNSDSGDVRNWGMQYFVGLVYFLLGSNPFAVQIISAVTGAATAVVVYFCAALIFQNQRVARYAAVAIAVFPAMIVWSSQMLKDGFIMLLLSIAMLAILKLQKTFSYRNVVLLLISLIGIFVLRFYLFPLLAVAAVGGFLIGSKTTIQSIVSRGVALVLLGLALAYLGILHQSQSQLARFGDLNAIENSRRYASSSNVAGSAFNSTANVSTVSGAIMALPEGMANLFAAPFPWQMEKITQMALFPEMLIWWTSLPLTFMGLWYALRNRLRENISILLFIIMLSFLYALYQGNLGTLYRQRTQLQVFLFIFTAVGLAIQIEKHEISKLFKAKRFELQRGRMLTSK